MNVLLVLNTPSTNTLALRYAAAQGLMHPDLQDIRLRARDPLDADADDVLWCDGLVLGMTENFAGMAGLMKDFFERIYYPCLEQTQGKPVALFIRAGEDGEGTIRQAERIIAGLRWKLIAPPLLLKGCWQDDFTAQVEELAMTLAAGLDAGIY